MAVSITPVQEEAEAAWGSETSRNPMSWKPASLVIDPIPLEREAQPLELEPEPQKIEPMPLEVEALSLVLCLKQNESLKTHRNTIYRKMLYLRIFYICSSYTYFPLHDYARGVDRGVFLRMNPASIFSGLFCLNLFNNILRFLTM